MGDNGGGFYGKPVFFQLLRTQKTVRVRDKRIPIVCCKRHELLKQSGKIKPVYIFERRKGRIESLYFFYADACYRAAARFGIKLYLSHHPPCGAKSGGGNIIEKSALGVGVFSDIMHMGMPGKNQRRALLTHYGAELIASAEHLKRRGELIDIPRRQNGMMYGEKHTLPGIFRLF